ncbi:LCP family protein [Actinomadura madurae]|uniref:Cell envelope-related function transcriptional attenuator common domain-containing protein n=1 Tax=Actinomadura madurae TaxID=1993 RepID=A0A1I5C2E7_9ACTN|nr:LCP family protein [Actinomadura madurae]SFN81169.1 cell envelope-related function transcriptional attenuator common domain-containing protein [Actinomadura madurae]SPT50841.1 Putative transcriptional regulator ywtF [Actinomadura madurae]
MADGHDSGRGDTDPLERYFRPRPGSHAADDGDGDIEGVTIDGMPAPRVPVESPRGPRRPGRQLSPRAAMSARRQKRFLTLTGTASAFVLLTSGGAWAFQNYVTGMIDKVSVGGLGKGKDAPKGAMTILVAGVDRREGLTKEQQKAAKLGHFEGERSDTMMLVHVSRDHDSVSVVSLPRDSYVTIPPHKSNGSEGAKGTRVGARPGKLTWAYQFGGPDLTVSTIKQATGVSIDHYVEVNFYGFVRMVDALGGVDVCTEQAVDDKKSGLRLPAGTSHVDGLKALAFARARYSLTGGSDLGRIDRQQQFMASLMKQALSTKTLSDPVKSTRFLNASLKSLRVDEELADDLPKLADQMKNLSTDDLTFAKVPLANPDYNAVLWNSPTPQSTVQWDQPKARDLFTKLRRDQPLTEHTAKPSASPTKKPRDELTVPPDDISLRVLNAIGTQGLATTAGRQLRGLGFEVTVVPGVARRGLQTTQVQYGPGREDSAKTVAAAIPDAKLKKVSSLGSRVQVMVGANWDGVKKVKVKPSPGASPSTSPAIETGTATQKLCG